MPFSSKGFKIIESKKSPKCRQQYVVADKTGKRYFGRILTNSILTTAIRNSSVDELHIEKIMSEIGLAPKIIDSWIKDDNILLVTELLGPTYQQYFDLHEDKEDLQNTINMKIDQAIAKMHEMGIIHGDLHGNNIVLKMKNKRPMDIYIIDFEYSFFIKNPNEGRIEYLEIFLDFESYDITSKGISGILERERNMYQV